MLYGGEWSEGSDPGRLGGRAFRHPKLAEPFLLTFDATVEFWPFMTPEDLERAGLESHGKK